MFQLGSAAAGDGAPPQCHAILWKVCVLLGIIGAGYATWMLCNTPCALWSCLQFLCDIDTTQVRAVFLRTRHSYTGEQTHDFTLNSTVSYI